MLRLRLSKYIFYLLRHCDIPRNYDDLLSRVVCGCVQRQEIKTKVVVHVKTLFAGTRPQYSFLMNVTDKVGAVLLKVAE